ncbi:uncharacterized protein [Pempheris klunzingeri]|uniref:uncharacterized protein n=1 Tax=Pempheris klunzingeri TaxID=3127111 RepID=UPI00397F14B9
MTSYLCWPTEAWAHRVITQRSVLRKTAEVCRDIAASEGRDFNLKIDDNLSVTKVQNACSSTTASTSPLPADMFQTALNDLYFSNEKVDFSLALIAEYHFHDETFQKGRNIITAGVASLKANVKLDNFEAGRQTLGQVCHTLQDFYSHSNWVELGKATPYSTLIRPDQPLENLAGLDTPTCKSCTGNICTDNILPEVLQQGLLTSGYFNKHSSAKPAVSKVSNQFFAPPKSLESGNFLVKFSGVPAGDFVVHLRGQDVSSTSRSTPGRFQRQGSTQIKTSTISVTAQADDINIEPGSTISIPFTVSSDTTGTFTVRVSNDRSFSFTSPSTVDIVAGSGGKVNGTVTLTASDSAASGTDVTLIIEVEDAAAADINYAVLRFSVTARSTDLAGPVCQIINISGICLASSSLCVSSRWELIANFTDGINGTGIVTINVHQGNGTLNTSMVAGAGGENITVATYSASCCSQSVQLAAVDRVGNVGRCVARARGLTITTAHVTTTAPTTMAVVKTTSSGGHTFTLSHRLWICVGVPLLWQ